MISFQSITLPRFRQYPTLLLCIPSGLYDGVPLHRIRDDGGGGGGRGWSKASACIPIIGGAGDGGRFEG